MLRTSKYLKGKRAEKKASRFLEKKDYNILYKNWRCSFGEIDIVAKKENILCFIEVKSKTSSSFGLPRESVDRFKKDKLIKLAKYFVSKNDFYQTTGIRFDVVEIMGRKINLIQNAFTETEQ
ncbi:MAG: YraN family protein [Elusimicrobiota bacterium]